MAIRYDDAPPRNRDSFGNRNSFSVGRPEALGDEELRDRIAIYRALLERLDGHGNSILRTKEDVSSALQELEEEADRRHGA